MLRTAVCVLGWIMSDLSQKIDDCKIDAGGNTPCFHQNKAYLTPFNNCALFELPLKSSRIVLHITSAKMQKLNRLTCELLA